MLKKFAHVIVTLVATLSIVFMGAIAAPSTAVASPNIIGTVKIRAKVSASAIASASASSKATASASSYTYVAAQIKSKKKTTSTCKRTTGYNSVYSGGKIHWYYDGTPSYICKLKKPVKVGKYTVKWIKKGGGTTGRNCGNYFRPKKGPKTKAAILDVKSKTTATIKTSATAKASVKASVRVELTAWYNGKKYTEVKVVDTAKATASAKASATAKIKVDKKTTLKTSGAAIKKAKLEAETKAKAAAEAKAKAAVKVRAEAEVDMIIEIPIEGPETPKPEPTPVLVGTETINDVLVNNERTIEVTGVVPTGLKGTLFATANNGGTVIERASQEVSGVFTTTIRYKAPSEVPAANGDIAAGRDRVSFTLTLSNGKSVSISTNQFVIMPRPVTPL